MGWRGACTADEVAAGVGRTVCMTKADEVSRIDLVAARGWM